jgi:Tol biopolymer transport system component
MAFTAYSSASSDGQWLVYASDHSREKQLSLWRQPLPGGQPVRLTRSLGDDIDPAVSPDGQWIAFRRGRDRDGGVYIIPATGGTERLVAHFGFSPRFSPDGRHLTYWTQDPATQYGKAFVIPVREGVERQIARGFDDVHNPIWTPDGKHLLVCGTRHSGREDAEHDLWVASIDGPQAIKTGAMALLGAEGLTPHVPLLSATSFQWIDGGLLLAAQASDDTVNLWRLPLTGPRWLADKPPTRITQETHATVHPSVFGSRFVFTSIAGNVDVWSAPLGGDGTVQAGLEPLTLDTGFDLSPSISADDQVIAFLSRREGPLTLFRKYLRSPHEAPIPVAGATNRFKLTVDGKAVVYRVFEGEGVPRQAIYSTELATGGTRRICGDCGAPTYASANAERVLFETGHRIIRLAVLLSSTGTRTDVLSHSHHPVRSGRLSPDGRLVAFQLDRGLDGRQIFIAPYREGAVVPTAEWAAVTEPTGTHQEPWWSVDGERLYYLSDRDGWRCVWMQRRSGGRWSAPVPVLHLHETRRTPLSFLRLDPHYIGLGVSKERLVLSLAETVSTIWTATYDGAQRRN